MTEIDYWDWFILVAIFMVLEMLLPGVVFLWLAIGAAIAGVAAFVFADFAWQGQAIIFGIASLASAFAGRAYFMKHPITTEDATLNRRGEHYIGKHYKLVTDIVNGRGRVKVEDSEWSVSGPDCKKGTMVRVLAVDGNTLMVEKV